jgi:hypothetical protein
MRVLWFQEGGKQIFPVTEEPYWESLKYFVNLFPSPENRRKKRTREVLYHDLFVSILYWTVVLALIPGWCEKTISGSYYVFDLTTAAATAAAAAGNIRDAGLCWAHLSNCQPGANSWTPATASWTRAATGQKRKGNTRGELRCFCCYTI